MKIGPVNAEIYSVDLEKKKLGKVKYIARLGLAVRLGLALIIHTSRKSRTASYLALRRIWHDTGPTSVGSSAMVAGQMSDRFTQAKISYSEYKFATNHIR